MYTGHDTFVIVWAFNVEHFFMKLAVAPFIVIELLRKMMVLLP